MFDFSHNLPNTSPYDAYFMKLFPMRSRMADNHVKDDASAGEDGGFYPVEPAYAAAVESTGDSVDQVDPADPSNGNPIDSFHTEPNGTRAAEDGGREDMFVDCPDEIENSESNQNSGEKYNQQDDQYNESDSGVNFQELMAEIELLRDKLEKSVSENEKLARENEEERAVLMRELAHLCYQLKTSNEQHITSGETADGMVNHLQTEVETWDVKTMGSEASLHEMINECSRFLKIAVNESLETEEKVRELHSVLYMKDQEIDYLNAKVAELSESSNIAHSNSQLYELQLEKDQHIEEIVNRILASVSMVHNQEELLDGSLTEKISIVEKSVTFLVEKYNLFISENDQLKECLNEVGLDLNMIDENGAFVMARDKIHELRRKEDNLNQSLSNLEDENRKLVEQLEKQRSTVENINAEVGRLSAEVEQEKNRYANTKEKLSMAVTKGKALVQQRDSLKQLLAEKTSQLEKYSVELQEKSTALEAAEKTKELSKEEAMKLQSEIAKTKEAANGEIDHLTTSLLAEIQDKNYLLAELDDLRNKYEAHERTQHELAEARESVTNEIDQLRTSLLAESQEKSYLQLELEKLRDKYEGVVQKEYLVSMEKVKIVNMLMEASGLANGGHEEVRPDNSDMTTIIDNCLAKIKEDTRGIKPSQIDAEIAESFKSLLYIKDQEMSLYKLIIEEDILDRAQVSNLSDELEMKTQELNALKDENAVMQKSLVQLEDRCALLKEKLSMAVKKGKGLVQERENLKGSLDEKKAEIARLKSELQENLSRYTECQDQINKLSLDAERISLLETDLFVAKERVDQLEQFLAESNSMLQRVMESIEGITTPTDLSFEEPVEKVKWVAQYLSENESLMMEMEQELSKVKDEASSLASKLSEVQTTMQSLEDALSVAEDSRSQLLDEKKELEISKTLLEEELQKEKEKASSRTRKFEELSVSKGELEDALSLAEDNISKFMNERDIAIESRTLAEEQLLKLKEELSDHIIKLADAEKTIQSLEDALSQAQKNITLLSEENSKVQIDRVDLDSERKKIREEADSHASKLSEASLTIKSLEDALSNAENNMADLLQEKKIAEQEIVSLNAKLESYMEELAGTRGSIENRSLELSGQLSRLHLLLEDEKLPSLLGQCFDRKFKSLNSIDFLLKEIADCFLEMDSDVLQNSPVMEDDSSLSTTLPSSPDTAFNMEILNDKVNAVDSESLVFQIEKINERFHLKSKILADKFDNLSTLMDDLIAALLRRLHLTKDRLTSIIKYTQSLKQKVTDIKTDKQRQEETIASLETEIRILLSACTDATQGLELNVRKNVSELRSVLELAKLDGKISMDLRAVGDDTAEALVTDHVKTAEKLLVATRQNEDLSKQFQDAINKLMSITEDMQNKMKETQLTCDEVLEERDLYKDKISKLEADLKAQQNLCHEMTVKLDDYKDQEDELRKIEAELSISLSKVHELEGSVLSAIQLKSILDKVNEVEIPDAAFAVGDSHDSADARKLLYVIDSYNGFLQKISSLSSENEELQSTIDKQILEIELLKKQVVGENEELKSTIDKQSLEIEFLKKQVGENEELQSTIDQQILEIELLKRQVEDHMDNEKNSEKMNKLLELESGLQNIVRNLGESDSDDDLKIDGATSLLPLIDKLVMAKMLESDSLKSKNEELGAKLVGAQKVVEELSNRVKFLEDSNQARIIPPEIDQERGTSVASLSTQSEISEMQDMATVGMNNNIHPVQSAAHARTLRKGSSDHLAINLDSESERFINNKESDEDKGHVFKSLNTSGLIPRQGRTVADRIDGIWVSGSRALMSHPRGRLGLIAYLLVLHIWLLENSSQKFFSSADVVAFGHCDNSRHFVFWHTLWVLSLLEVGTLGNALLTGEMNVVLSLH
ncbi:hypothetical protein DH2020_003700 [Rehmannia glutinosa]|uniref:Uncharacterized protein n=1 Tax=Rehmannia glutinosa TaxID=99300 RepID=A0ABR0XMB7_REHGL